MTIAEQALALPIVDSGDWFSVPEVAAALGTKETSTRKALNNLVRLDKLEVEQRRPYRPAKYRRKRAHWLNQRPLADTSWLRANA